MKTHKTRILIVEDDPGIVRFMRTLLLSDGYDVTEAGTGTAALELISSSLPDLVLLDLGLPDMDGNRVIHEVRTWSRLPILVISARSMEEDKAKALDLGADDYLTKPFGNIELLARIRTALRHTRTVAENDDIAVNGVYTVGALTVDYRLCRAFLDGRDVGLTPIEFRIVAFLGTHAGQVVTYNALMRELWGPASGPDNRGLRVHMASIRRKLEPNPDEPHYILTETGVGYRLIDKTDEEE